FLFQHYRYISEQWYTLTAFRGQKHYPNRLTTNPPPSAMATANIALPTYNLNQEHHCNKHKHRPRYYRLKWEHLTISIKDAKDALNTALPYPFYAVFSCIVCRSLNDAMDCPYNGLYWDEVHGVYFDRSLDVLVDVGVTTRCAAAPCGRPHLAISLGGQIPSIESFRTSGLRFYNVEGAFIQDRRTVFDRVYREQIDLGNLAEDTIGQPIVKSVRFSVLSDLEAGGGDTAEDA
ncbi:hypothetical protein GQ44DRAFT_788135, partial [Phaeosphaeriaceae sp. PMI808]